MPPRRECLGGGGGGGGGGKVISSRWLLALVCLLLVSGEGLSQERQECDPDIQLPCNDHNSCTFDWCDAGSRLCRHDNTVCPRCDQDRSPGVDYVVMTPGQCSINASELSLASRVLTGLLEATDHAGVHSRVAMVNMSPTVSAKDDSLNVSLGWTVLTSAVETYWEERIADANHVSSDSPAAGPVEEMYTLTRLLATGNLTPVNGHQTAGTASGDGSYNSPGLEFRPHTNVHVLVFPGLCDGEPVQKIKEEDLSTWMGRAVDAITSTASGQNNTVSLSVFVAGDDRQRRAVYGNPALDSAYVDGRGFSRAVTLQALIKAGSEQASSLQAYLLAAGVEMRVFALARASAVSHDIARYSYPGLLEPGYVLCSKCVTRECANATGCAAAKVACGSGEICSPSVGCVVEEQTPSADRPLVVHSPAYTGDVTPLERPSSGKSAESTSPGMINAGSSKSDGRVDAGVNPPLESEGFDAERNDSQNSCPKSKDGSSGSNTGCGVMEESSANHWRSQPVPEDEASRASCVTRAPWREALSPRPVQVRRMDPTLSFIKDIIGRGEPVILRNTLASQWPALTKWTEAFLLRALDETLLNVKRTRQAVTFDPDRSAPMATLNALNLSTPYTVHNMTRGQFFAALEDDRAGHYYFTDLPPSLQDDLSGSRLIFASDEDFKLRRHFLWLSSGGMVTHTHFDQDYNFFVQLSGHKTFTLWMPEDHGLMYAYPRLHPMWHKSQVDPAAVDSSLYPLFNRSRPFVACLSAGDMLYVPPYAWHHVVSETRSVSVSSYSHDNLVREHMNAIYKHDHKFDLLAKRRGKMFVLRMFLDIMIHNLYGKEQTRVFFNRLLGTRYRGLEKVFPIRRRQPRLCHSQRGAGHMPTAQHVYGYASFDATVVTRHFMALPSVVRDILFLDYVEEVSAEVVGIEDVYAFFRYCFQRDVEYYLTSPGDAEHSLWDHAEESPESPEVTDLLS